MFRRTVLAGLVAVAASMGAVAATDDKPSYPALFDATWNAVNDNFYDPAFHGVDWKQVGDKYRARLGGVTNDKQFDALASAMLAEIGTSHLYIVPPSASSASGTGIGVRFHEIGGETIVTDVALLAEARQRGIHAGDRLLTPRDALSGTVGTSVNAKFEDCAGHARTVGVHRVGAFWPPPHPGFEWWTVKTAANRTIGYIRIDRFDDGAAELADRAMVELKDTSGIVIDVRANSGGNLSALRLVSYFVDGSRPAAALFARPYLKVLGHPVTGADVLAAAKTTGAYSDDSISAAVSAHQGAATFWTDDVGDKRYTKPVVVLIGEDTGSAAEGFAWGMKAAPHAKLVGRKTAGALLSATDFDLPGGWRVVVPVQGVWGADGTDYRDRAVPPDVAVRWTRADVCAGRDPDIAEALSLLNG
jgi:carboxyl-terminal processing protease